MHLPLVCAVWRKTATASAHGDDNGSPLQTGSYLAPSLRGSHVYSILTESARRDVCSNGQDGVALCIVSAYFPRLSLPQVCSLQRTDRLKGTSDSGFNRQPPSSLLGHECIGPGHATEPLRPSASSDPPRRRKVNRGKQTSRPDNKRRRDSAAKCPLDLQGWMWLADLQPARIAPSRIGAEPSLACECHS